MEKNEANGLECRRRRVEEEEKGREGEDVYVVGERMKR